MYYGMILIAVVMFGGCFGLDDLYRKLQGSSLCASLQFSLFSSLAGLLVLFAVNGFRPEFTLFTFIIAFLASCVNLGFSFCGFRALGVIDLSVYSLFSMLGGMLLPFLQGILFYGEALTAAKIVCLVLISTALFVTVKGIPGKKGAPYYLGIFLLNGLAGVLSRIFASAPYEKTSAAGYSVLTCLIGVLLSALLLPVFGKKRADVPRFRWKGLGVSVLNGAINKAANFLLVLALMHVDSSAEYPMVTGGVIIVSTVLCFFGEKKPTKRELVSVLLAFAGLMALFLIPG